MSYMTNVGADEPVPSKHAVDSFVQLRRAGLVNTVGVTPKPFYVVLLSLATGSFYLLEARFAFDRFVVLAAGPVLEIDLFRAPCMAEDGVWRPLLTEELL